MMGQHFWSGSPKLRHLGGPEVEQNVGGHGALCTARASPEATPKGHVPWRSSPGTQPPPEPFPHRGSHTLGLTDTHTVGLLEIALTVASDTLGFKCWLRAFWLKEPQENYFISQSPGRPPAPQGTELEGLSEAIMSTLDPAQGLRVGEWRGWEKRAWDYS